MFIGENRMKIYSVIFMFIAYRQADVTVNFFFVMWSKWYYFNSIPRKYRLRTLHIFPTSSETFKVHLLYLINILLNIINVITMQLSSKLI